MQRVGAFDNVQLFRSDRNGCGEGEGFAGNWKYNKDTTRLTINYEIKPVDFVDVTEVTSDEVNNMLIIFENKINKYFYDVFN